MSSNRSVAFHLFMCQNPYRLLVFKNKKQYVLEKIRQQLHSHYCIDDKTGDFLQRIFHRLAFTCTTVLHAVTYLSRFMRVPSIRRVTVRTRGFCLHKVFKSTVPTSNEAAPNGRQLIATLEDSNESAN